MKVCLFVTNSDLGGAPKHVLSLLENMHSDNSIDPHIIVGSEGPIVSKITSLGYPVRTLRNLSSEINLCSDFRNFILFCVLLKQLRPDILHVHSSKAGLFGRLASIIFSIPVVYTIHGWGFGQGRPLIRSCVSYILELLMLPFTSAYIFVSTKDIQCFSFFYRVFKRRFYHIPNGVAPIQGHPSSNPPRDCLMLARVSPQKDHVTLFKALNISPFSLTLAGLGTDSSDFYSLAKVILGDNISYVSFLGQVEDVASLLYSHRVVLLASNYESLPLSLIEGLSAGLPVVATDVGDVNKIVLHGVNGYLVKKGDSHDLSYSIGKILADYSFAKSASFESRRLFDDVYSSELMYSKTLGVYHLLHS